MFKDPYQLYYFAHPDNMIDVIEMLVERFPISYRFTVDPHFVEITCPAYRRDEIDDFIILFAEQ